MLNSFMSFSRLLLILFFCLIWILLVRKYFKTRRGALIASMIMATLTSIVFYPALEVWNVVKACSYKSQDFDKAKWSSEIETRFKMSDKIIESGMLLGKSKSEVEEILGKGSQQNWNNKDILEYYLGFVPCPFKIDPDILAIEFYDGKAIKVSQYEG